jgi:hypothetical protein
MQMQTHELVSVRSPCARRAVERPAPHLLVHNELQRAVARADQRKRCPAVRLSPA